MISKKQIQDAAKFSNFSQKFKSIVWDYPITIPEETLDKIALELWGWLKVEDRVEETV